MSNEQDQGKLRRLWKLQKKQDEITGKNSSIVIPPDEYLMTDDEVVMLKNEFETLKVMVSDNTLIFNDFHESESN